MKRFFVASLACAVACAQTPPTTPNLGLYLPSHGSYNWDSWYNANWSILDQSMLPAVSPMKYGAKCDGVTDDSAAFASMQAALLAAGGGHVVLPNRRCYCKSTWTESVPNVLIEGSGPASELYYDGTGTANDTQRALYVVGAFSALQALSNSGLSIGATSITAASATSTATLAPGQWIQLEEIDPTVGDITYFDFTQIASVSGTTINLVQPLRTAFPAYQTINFRAFSNPLGGIALRNFRITTPYIGGSGLPGLIIAQGRGVRVDNVTVDAGKGISTYRADDIVIRDSHVIRSTNQASEFAATVDLRVESTYFAGENNPSALAIGNVTLDLGTAFFSFVGNNLNNPQNVALSIAYNVHDGAVAFNSVGFLTASAGQLGGGGIVARGAQRLIVIGNNFNGAASTLTSIAVSFGDATATNTISSTGNVIAWNNAQGYTQLHDAGYSANDLYVDASTAGVTIARYLQSIATGTSSYAQRFDLTGLVTGLSAGTYTGTNTYGFAAPESSTYGGYRTSGYTSSSATGEVAGVRLFGVSGQSTPGTPPALETCGKVSGGAVVHVGNTDFCWGVENNPGSSNRVATVMGNGWMLLSNTGQAAETPAQMFEVRSATAPAIRITKYGANNYDIGYGLDGSNNLTFSFGGSVKAGIGFGGNFISGTGTGVSCSGAPSASFAVVGGIVTHC